MGQIMATLRPTLRPSSSTNSENTKKRKRNNSSCSEEDEIIITSSLTSSSTPRWKHDVFLSFCGKDTRSSFTDHLYFYLKWKGILVFRDDESLERGKCISPELLQAIQESRYAIVIFSANYASSKWCLRELAMIIEWEEKKNLTIIPIFYHVDPSDVRKQGGTFKEAFAAHEKDPMVDIEEIDTWRKACTKVGNLAGEHINGERYESTIIQQISGIIFYNYTMLNIRIHYDGQKLVGINSRVEEMINLLDMESNDVRFFGIHGMGGVGKTTLAEIIYGRVSCQFEGSSFISCIREKSTTARDLASLQKELLSMIMQDQEIRIWDHHQGIMVIRTSLRNKKVLIILDDVDSEKQLTALAGNQKWFGPGSRVIIICRDNHLLITHEVNDIYKVELLQTADALQLFSLSAFDKTNPPENYKDLSMNFVHYAGGLPLALKVLGRFLFGRTIDAWKSARDQLEANPKKEIFDILKISFDGLEELQQKMFLDVACFSQEFWPLCVYVKKIYPAIDIDVLVNKSLISKSKNCFDEPLKLHDLLKKMGQEIVRREDPNEPGRRSRLFDVEDVYDVLKNDTGTDAIEGIFLHHYAIMKHGEFNAEAFSKMRKLRFLCFSANLGCIKWHGNPLQYMPSDKLRFLHWDNCPSKSWPSSFQQENLIVLSMPNSCFKRLWEGLMALHNLKHLDLKDSENLIETPDLSGAPNLEEIQLKGCTSLCKIHPSIGFLKRLECLSLDGCSRLMNFQNIPGDMTSLKSLSLNFPIFPSVIYSLSSLESLRLDGCSRLEKFPDHLSRLECLKEFKAYGTAITQIPSVNLIPKSIHSFELKGQKRMPRKSRDSDMFINDCSLSKQSSYPTNHDIGSAVEYEMEEMLEVVEALGISLYRPRFYNPYSDVWIQRWSLGSRIPEWVHNKSNGSSLFFDMCKGSSLKIELDGNTMSRMGIAIFIVCQFHSIPPVNFSGYETVAFPIWLDDGTPENPLICQFEFALSTDVILDKPIVLWQYLWDPVYLRSWKLKSLDKRKISTTAKFMQFVGQTPFMEVEVKEWGLHLVCPDDATLGLGSDLDSFVNFINYHRKCDMMRNED